MMNKKLLTYYKLLIFAATSLLANNVIGGSFHYQIDVMTQLVSNQPNKINTVEMSWLYDEKMTNMLLQDEDITPAKRQQTLDTVADLIMTDLKGLNYFTQIKVNGKKLTIKQINDYGIELIDDKYLRLLFTIPVTQPVDLKKSTFSISLSDPNGAAMLFYDTAERIEVDKSITAKCAVKLINHDEFEHGKAAQRVDISCQ